jgi:hypothetical protein
LWKILYELKQKKLVRMDIMLMDSTTARRIGTDVGRCEKKGRGIGRNAAGTGTKIHVIMGEKRPLRVHVSGANGRDLRMAYRMPDGLNLKAASDVLRIKAVTMAS